MRVVVDTEGLRVLPVEQPSLDFKQRKTQQVSIMIVIILLYPSFCIISIFAPYASPGGGRHGFMVILLVLCLLSWTPN